MGYGLENWITSWIGRSLTTTPTKWSNWLLRNFLFWMGRWPKPAGAHQWVKMMGGGRNCNLMHLTHALKHAPFMPHYKISQWRRNPALRRFQELLWRIRRVCRCVLQRACTKLKHTWIMGPNPTLLVFGCTQRKFESGRILSARKNYKVMIC